MSKALRNYFMGFGFGVVFMAALFLGPWLEWGDETSAQDSEWVMPARFEAEGAFTLGCSLWDQPGVLAFSDENPNTGFMVLTLAGNREEGYAMEALIDRRDGGTFSLTGSHCGTSIDWSAFDSQRTKGERPKP